MHLKPPVASSPSTPLALARWARARTGSERLARALEAAAQADPKNALAAAKLREAQAAQQKLKRMPGR